MFSLFRNRKNDYKIYLNAILIQSVYRMYIVKKQYKKTILGITLFQRLYRKFCAKRYAERLIKKITDSVITNLRKRPLKKTKIYHKYLNNEVIDIRKYRRDYDLYLNTNYNYDHLKEYERYDNKLNCRNILYKSIMTSCLNISLLRNCLIFNGNSLQCYKGI